MSSEQEGPVSIEVAAARSLRITPKSTTFDRLTFLKHLKKSKNLDYTELNKLIEGRIPRPVIQLSETQIYDRVVEYLESCDLDSLIEIAKFISDAEFEDVAGPEEPEGRFKVRPTDSYGQFFEAQGLSYHPPSLEVLSHMVKQIIELNARGLSEAEIRDSLGMNVTCPRCICAENFTYLTEPESESGVTPLQVHCFHCGYNGDLANQPKVEQPDSTADDFTTNS